MLTWLDALLGFKEILENGVVKPLRARVNFIGATVTDNPAQARLDVEFIGTGVPTSRQVIAGAGLTGGGPLTVDRTLNVAANADGSILVNPDDIQVGVLATDAQHGFRGSAIGESPLHALASSADPGFMSSQHYDDLANAGETAVASTLVKRGTDGVLRQILAGVGVAALVGAQLTNSTAAAAGVQQYSPVQAHTGQGGSTDAGGASMEAEFGMQTRPVQGAAAPSAELHFLSQIDGAGWTSRASIDSAGKLTATTFSGSGTVASTGFVRGSKNATLLAVDGAGAYDLNVVGTDNADGVVVGDATRAASVIASAKTAGYFAVNVNGAEVGRMSATGIALTSSNTVISTSGTNLLLQPNAGGIFLDAAGITWRGLAGGGGAGVITASADFTSVTIGQAQDTSASGANWSLRAQRGFAGTIGGDLTIGGGDGGSLGTNAAGNTNIVLGTAVGGATTAYLKIWSAIGVDLLTFRQSGATSTLLQGAKAYGLTIGVETDTANSVTGKSLTLSAQSCSGTTTNGGALYLRAGSGTDAAGNVSLIGATTLVQSIDEDTILTLTGDVNTALASITGNYQCDLAISIGTDSSAGTGKSLTLKAGDMTHATLGVGGPTVISGGDGGLRGGDLALVAGRGLADNGDGGHTYVLSASRTGTGVAGNLGLIDVPAAWESMSRGLFVGDAAAAPTANPASGLFLWSDGGLPSWRTSAGTILKWGAAAATASAGAGALPATPEKFLTVTEGGTVYKIPLYLA